MKKLTDAARVIDLFSTAPLDRCAELLSIAQQIVKNRTGRNTPKGRKAKVAATDLTGSITLKAGE